MCYSNCPYELHGTGEDAGKPCCSSKHRKAQDAHCYEEEEAVDAET